MPCSRLLTAGLLSAVLLVATPIATADTTTGTTTDRRRPRRRRPSPRCPRPPVPRPTTIAAGVTIGGDVLVGGLSPAEATAEVKAFFARPLLLKVGKVTLRVTPKQLGASAYVGDAVKRARIVAPGANVPLKVKAPLPRIQRYARTLAKRFDRTAVDSKLLIRNAAVRDQGAPGPAHPPGGRRPHLFRSVKTHEREPMQVQLDRSSRSRRASRSAT